MDSHFELFCEKLHSNNEGEVKREKPIVILKKCKAKNS